MLFKRKRHLVVYCCLLYVLNTKSFYLDLNINVTECCPFGNLLVFNNLARLSHRDYCQRLKTIYRRIQWVAHTTARGLLQSCLW